MANPSLNKQAIVELGGGQLWLAECDSDGGNTGTPYQFGYISGSGHDDNTPQTGQFDESGLQVGATDGIREVMVRASPMQKDRHTLEFAPKTSVGKYYHLAYKVNPPGIPLESDGKDTWRVYGIVKAERTMSFTTPGAAGPEVAFRALANSSALTLDLTDVNAGLNAVAIAANEYYTHVQTAT